MIETIVKAFAAYRNALLFAAVAGAAGYLVWWGDNHGFNARELRKIKAQQAVANARIMTLNAQIARQRDELRTRTASLQETAASQMREHCAQHPADCGIVIPEAPSIAEPARPTKTAKPPKSRSSKPVVVKRAATYPGLPPSVLETLNMIR